MWNLGFEKLRETPRILHGWLTSNPYRQKLSALTLNSLKHACENKIQARHDVIKRYSYRDRKWRKLMQVFSFSFLRVFGIKQHSVVVDRPLLRYFSVLCRSHATISPLLLTKFNKSRPNESFTVQVDVNSEEFFQESLRRFGKLSGVDKARQDNRENFQQNVCLLPLTVGSFEKFVRCIKVDL